MTVTLGLEASRTTGRRQRFPVRRPGALIGSSLLVAFVAIGLFGPTVAPFGPREAAGPVFQPPSFAHPLGLDDGGVDVVSLLLNGAGVSLLVGFGGALISILIGSAVGIAAGYFRGMTDVSLMRMNDYFLVIPRLPLMIIVAALWGPSLINVILIIGLLSWTLTARIFRAQTRSITERTYVRRVRLLGASHVRIVTTHVLPQVAPLILAYLPLLVADAVFSQTALAFIGLDDPGTLSWGRMIENAFRRSAVSSGAWWAIVPPGLCVAALILAANLVGQSFEDILNPRLKASHLSIRRFRVLRGGPPA